MTLRGLRGLRAWTCRCASIPIAGSSRPRHRPALLHRRHVLRVISAEADETLAIAMKIRIGGRLDTGKGGEDRKR